MKTILMAAVLFFTGLSVTDAQSKSKVKQHKTHHKAKHKTHAMKNVADTSMHKSGTVKMKTTTKKK